jgi:hypothetical protein
MESKKIVEIRISPEGEITVEGLGFQGDACDIALDPFLKALGAARETRRKPEYFQGVSRETSRGRTIRVGDE